MIRVLLTAILTIIISNQATLGTVAGTSDNVGISGGKPISIETAPFMVSLWRKSGKSKKYRPFCGGSIIHEWFILTAAHCFGNTAVPVSYIKVYIGSAKLNGKDRVLHKVKNKSCHEEFSFDRYGNDICLLQLTRPVKFGPEVAKVGLPAEDLNLEPGTEVNVTGWGVTETGNNMTNNLRQTTVPIAAAENCRNEHKHLTDREICAGSRGHDACDGDSGGPLTYNNVQIGLVSYGDKCRLYSNGVGVYTRVSSYLKWINETISNNLP